MAASGATGAAANVLRRLVRPGLVANIGANSVAQLVRIALQLVSVPLLAHALGLERYGVWLLLSTVPGYLANGDFGLVIASGNAMTASIARGDRAGAAATFHAMLRAVGGLMLAIAGLALAGLALLPADAFGPFGSADPHPRVLLGLIALLGAIIPLTQAMLAGLRATGDYAVGTYWMQVVAVAEAVLVLGTAVASGALWMMALVYCGVRLVGTIWLASVLRRRWPFYFAAGAGVAAARPQVRALLRPAIAAAMLPLGHVAVLQGSVAVLGAVLGPAMLPIFTATRTLARLPLQLAAIVNAASLPGFTAAQARGDKARADDLVTLTLAAIGLVLVPAAAAMALGGAWIIGLWTAGAIHPAPGFVALMVLAALLGGCWGPLSGFLLATDRQAGFSYAYLGIALAALLAARLILPTGGLAGLAGVLAAMDLALLALVLSRLREHRLIDWPLVKGAPARTAQMVRTFLKDARFS